MPIIKKFYKKEAIVNKMKKNADMIFKILFVSPKVQSVLF
jgi:hypothetical protein